MRAIVLALIGCYRRYISPYKGFSCAYRVHTGGASCSAHGLRVVQRFGAMRGLLLIRRRLKACGNVYRQHRQASPAAWKPASSLQRQAGFCDVPCDIPCDGGFDACDAADCACDIFDIFGDKRKKEKEKECSAAAGLQREDFPGFS